MPNEKLYREFQNFERKLRLMVSENRMLKENLHQVKKENELLKEELESQKIKLSSFQNQIKISKLANNIVVGIEDSVQIQERIDSYIKKVDECIVHLTK